MSELVTDRFGQKYGAGDFVVYGTRVGNVGATRFALVTDVTISRVGAGNRLEVAEVTVKPLQKRGDSWTYGRSSKPTVDNIVKITLPDSDGIHLV